MTDTGPVAVQPSGPPSPLPDPDRRAAPERRELEDRGSEEAFDRLTRLARRALRVPIALLTLVGEDHITVKSSDTDDGSWQPARRIALDTTFCPVVVRTRRPFVVCDVALSPRTRDAPAAGRDIGAYAGVPVLDPAGHVLGALCAIDAEPRRFTDDDLAVLDDLGAMAATELAAQALARQAHQALRTIESSADLILGLDAEGVVLSANPALTRGYGYAVADVLGRPLTALVPDDRREEIADLIGRVLAGDRVVDLTGSLTHRDGTRRDVSLSLSPLHGAGGEIRGMSMIGRDVSERRRAEGELRRLADQDPLTGLLNRRAFRVALRDHLEHPRDADGGGAVLVLDLDNFKAVNDEFGHAAGDEVIIAVADVLRRCVRDADVLARLGGDEFAVLLPRASANDAAGLAHRLLEALRHPPHAEAREANFEGSRSDHLTGAAGPHGLRVSTSIGIALVPAEGGTIDELLDAADLAMYDAKDAGRSSWTVAGDDRPEPRIGAQMSWMQRIRRALDEERFELVAQPVLDLRTGDIAQHELLLRMIGDSGEPIAPGDFLPAADRFNLIQEIDRWVLRKAIGLVAAHDRAGQRLPVAVNVAAKTLSDPELLPLLRRELARSQIDPTLLTFEIAEEAAIAHLHHARTFARGLSALGCRVALDDFGTGPVSLAHLKHLPVDTLKIDGEFVAACVSSRPDELIVDAVVRIAQGLGKQTIAECVPDDRTIDYLRAHGVDFAQGFHIGAPRTLRAPG